MISVQQIERVKTEFTKMAIESRESAKLAENELENYTYRSNSYDPHKRQQLLREFEEADYFAESTNWILNLINDAINNLEKNKII